MLKIGLIGFGFMGRMHFDNYVRLMEEGCPVTLTAICDPRIEELKDGKAGGNMTTAREVYDLSAYNLYTDLEEMLANEQLDVIDIAAPTYLHAEMACSLLERGIHVFCEKPMARHSVDAWKMVETAKRNGRKLMIGQCLRFWPGYEYLKDVVDSGKFGQTTEGYFYRGSGAPKEWFLDEKLSGGCIMDMHIHDTDMINYLFGKPEKVSTLGRNVLPGSGYDIASTHYYYKDGKVINAQVDWTLKGDFGFYMGYRVNFERGNVVFDGSRVKVNPNDGPGFTPEISPDAGYYRELDYFLDAVIHDKPVAVCTPESAAESLELVEAEIESADAQGEWVKLV
ncbi:Gfo/Idh/MocA family protein [Paenibacillus sp. URB8-2]|uniref:Gfo/Idh/MocA family protein n=1 Tax=Paenibacillus sp. URB8-2 TaxID=2741301 RepID=UPI0015BCA05F|nr:Gfo/Idh/MocA family oxidoreductase [Paenibacillus sp. URB8-2]BCG58266.1 dehydrogenase [Paenibacillus sp. URB8-2]